MADAPTKETAMLVLTNPQGADASTAAVPRWYPDIQELSMGAVNPPDPAASQVNSVAADTGREIFAESPYKELKAIEVRILNRQIELKGTVSSYFMKQMAQETVRQRAPHLQIRNILKVATRR